jgi:hypothetical protein
MPRIPKVKFTGLVGAPATEFCETFVQYMANRMAVSYHKYGPVAEAYPNVVNALESMQKRLDLYLKGGEIKGVRVRPGNREYLIDAANFLMIEFMHPKHPKAFFKATDSNGSPGRVWNSGIETSMGHGRKQAAMAVEDFYAKRGSE